MQDASASDPKGSPWIVAAIVSGVLLTLTGGAVVALLGTAEGAQISQKWLALPGVCLVVFLHALYKIATRKH
jgi:hypothetical protein